MPRPGFAARALGLPRLPAAPGRGLLCLLPEAVLLAPGAGGWPAAAGAGVAGARCWLADCDRDPCALPGATLLSVAASPAEVAGPLEAAAPPDRQATVIAVAAVAVVAAAAHRFSLDGRLRLARAARWRACRA